MHDEKLSQEGQKIVPNWEKYLQLKNKMEKQQQQKNPRQIMLY